MKKILEIPKLVFVILFLSLFSLIEKQVVEAASFDFSPSEYTFYHQCPSRVNIEIDVTGDVSNAADIEIYFDPSEITIIDSNPNQSGKQIGTGDAYEIYFGNEVDEINGVIRLAGASFSNYVTNTKTFAYIDFESKIGFSGTTEFEINFTGVGDTKDSNIAETLTSDDLLDDVTNGAYDFTAPPFGSCTADVIPPNIIFVSPTPGQTGVPSWTTVRIQITDTLSGVNLDTVQFTINGEIYTPTSSQVVYSGSSLDYIFTINPSTEIFENDYNTVLVTATDYAGNTRNAQMVFNRPPTQTPPPPLPPTTPTPLVCEEVVCPTCQECTEIIETSTDLEPDIEQKCRDRLGTTLIETVIDNSPKYNMLVTTGLLATGIISYLMFLNTPGLLISLISMLLGKKEENPWGVVMDASTRKPISLALCKLFLAGTTNLVEQTITDNDGVYGFSISPGSYRLEVTKPGYEKEVLKFSFGEGEYGYVNDVMLSKTDLKATGQQDKPLIGTVFRSLLNIYRKLFPFLFGVGLVIAVFSEIYAPSTTNTIILILYIVVGSIYLYSIILEKQSKLSSIVDPSTSLRIPNALIKIFSLENGKLIDTKITNSMGFFDYWKEPGEYALHTSARGYSFPSEVQTDLEKIVVNSTPMLKVRLKKGKNKLKILVDPIES